MQGTSIVTLLPAPSFAGLCLGKHIGSSLPHSKKKFFLAQTVLADSWDGSWDVSSFLCPKYTHLSIPGSHQHQSLLSLRGQGGTSQIMHSFEIQIALKHPEAPESISTSQSKLHPGATVPRALLSMCICK